jgi:hypothetical protein
MGSSDIPEGVLRFLREYRSKECAMKLHVAMWAAVGLLVALGWFLYSSSAFPSPITRAEPVVWNLALWTQPIVLAGFRLHFGVSVYWVLLANTITYGLIGLIAETIHQA